MFQQSENYPAFDPEKHLAPAGREIGLGGVYFVEVLDSDRRCLNGPEILQWQPGVKAWCRYGWVATGFGNQIDRKIGRIISQVPFPDIENDRSFLLNSKRLATKLHRKIDKKEALDDADIALIRQMCIMFGDPI